MGGKAGRCIYIQTGKNKSPLCCHVPSAVKIAYGVMSAYIGGPDSCSTVCRMASLGGLGPGMEPHVSLRGARSHKGLARDADHSWEAVLSSQITNGNC